MTNIRNASPMSMRDRVLLPIAKARAMLHVFASRIWYSSERRVRDRLFRFLSEAKSAEFVYARGDTERYLVHCRDQVIGREVFVSGQFEFAKVEKALGALYRLTGRKKLDVLVDVGANIGTVCIPAVVRGLVTRAVAVEPDPTNNRLLRINVLLNEIESKMEVHQCAAGENENGTLQLERSDSNWGDHRISTGASVGDFNEQARQRIAVASTRLDSLVSTARYGEDMLIWMDTQGYEGFVLKGATELLKAKIPVVAEFWPYAMKRADSYLSFRQCVSHYNGFIDLNQAVDAEAIRPIAELDRLFQSLDTDKDAATDILLM